jgi:betaine-aldehyde dehydrogenase
MIERDEFFIGGEWQRPSGVGWLELVCPSTEQVFGRVPLAVAEDMDRAVAAARAAFERGDWCAMPVTERAAVFGRVARLLEQRTEEFAPLLVAEMGIPIATSASKVTATSRLLDVYVELVDEVPQRERRAGVFGPVEVVREPVGVVGAIVPWNGPLFVTMMKLAPALMSGCTAVLKPSPEVALDSYLIAECFEQAGLPPGVLSIVPAGRDVGAHLVGHPGVDKISFTGSTAAGRAIAAQCGAGLKRLSAELGGKSAAVVLDDADLDAVVSAVEQSALGTNGQQCFGLTRVLATPAVYDAVVERLADRVAALRVGDPFDYATQLGPLVSARQRDRVEHYITTGVEEGARMVAGGRSAPPKGWYVSPTVFADVKNSMRIAQEEIFGPVLCVIPVHDMDEAVAVANDSPYGLSGAVFTDDIERGLDVARRVRAGTYTINGFRVDWRAPFGGVKASGVGREHGIEVFAQYTETKSISLPA